MRILIVDDDAITASALKELMAMDGHEADHAANGHGALSMLPVFNPDVMVMDWKMPLVDGETLLCATRADPRWKRLPVLILTAMRPEELREEMDRTPDCATNVRVLYKPVPLADVKDEIHELTKMTV